MSGSRDEISRALDEASALDRPLQDRLDLLSTRRQSAQATYDRLVARLTKAGAGAEAPETGGQIPDFVLPDDRGRLVRLDELLKDEAERKVHDGSMEKTTTVVRLEELADRIDQLDDKLEW